MAESEHNGNAVSPAYRSELHRVIGEIVMFLGEHKEHRQMFTSDVHMQILPAVLLGQYKIFRHSKGQTVGYVSWAEASEDLEKRLLLGDTRVKLSEWQGGNKAIIVQLACLHGTDSKVLDALKAGTFAERDLFMVSSYGDGKACLKEIRMLGQD